MIGKQDEFLHDSEKMDNHVESYKVSFVSKKDKLYGVSEFTWLSKQNVMGFEWSMFINELQFQYENSIQLDGKLPQKVFTDNIFKYKIVKPLEKFELKLQNSEITTDLMVKGMYPYYDFIPDQFDSSESSEQLQNTRLWNSYGQRCRVSGDLQFKKGSQKGVTKKIDCIGFREHTWGDIYMPGISSRSRITAHFRDMTIDMTYLELEGNKYSHGFISKKSGNIGIVNIEMELVTFPRGQKIPCSTEFSYKDTQDDIDLLVSKALHSEELPVDKKMKKKYIRFRNFSDFTIIGTNKKGVGVEEHLISIEKLKSLE